MSNEHRDWQADEIKELRAQVERLEKAAQDVVAQKVNVASGYELFAQVNVLKLSALEAALQEKGDE